MEITQTIADIISPLNSSAGQKPTAWSIDLLKEIEWKRFEELSRAYFERRGLKAKTTKIGADGGVDIHLYQSESDTPSAFVQCKAWNKYKVGIKPVRELFGVMAADDIQDGFFMTTGVFTSEAKQFAKGKLNLVTGETLLRFISNLPKEEQYALLDVATEGDYTTPSCPRCGIKMEARESKKGDNPGSDFWGCTNYPKCKSTLKKK